jgi:hypothetical protein
MDIKLILREALAQADRQTLQYRDAMLRAEGGVQALEYVLHQIEDQETCEPTNGK